jgi:hypothetical protein
VVVGDRDVVIRERIAPPAMAEFGELVRTTRGAARKAGMRPADVKRAVTKVSASR